MRLDARCPECGRHIYLNFGAPAVAARPLPTLFGWWIVSDAVAALAALGVLAMIMGGPGALVRLPRILGSLLILHGGATLMRDLQAQNIFRRAYRRAPVALPLLTTLNAAAMVYAAIVLFLLQNRYEFKPAVPLILGLAVATSAQRLSIVVRAITLVSGHVPQFGPSFWHLPSVTLTRQVALDVISICIAVSWAATQSTDPVLIDLGVGCRMLCVITALPLAATFVYGLFIEAQAWNESKCLRSVTN